MSTITDPGKCFSLIPYGQFVWSFWDKLGTLVSWKGVSALLKEPDRKAELLSGRPFRIAKSGAAGFSSRGIYDPVVSTSFESLVSGACSLLADEPVFSAYADYADEVGSDLLMESLFMLSEPFMHDPGWITRLGRLGVKEEPAGKVRVFAMVEAWTQ